MALKLELKEDEKVVVNGAVFMVRPRGRGANLILLNHANVLRARDILREDEATTLERRLYLAIQVMYLFPHDCAQAQSAFAELVGQLLTLRPELSELLDEVRDYVADGDLYPALRRWGHALKSDDGQTPVVVIGPTLIPADDDAAERLRAVQTG